MKKLLVIVVLGFFFIANGNAAIIKKSPCSETNWSGDCSCANESNYVKKKYCNFKMGIKPEKYMSYCAEKAGEFKPEFRKKMYKSCMKDYGF
tara:strand:- start:47 stop:322 length:276 start_codon:yes stop_codon:yes gene_type:complete